MTKQTEDNPEQPEQIDREAIDRVWSRIEMEAEAFNLDREEANYRVGIRDGFSEAIQLLDQLTGGDGEYRFCLGAEDSERHCPTPVEMGQRILTAHRRRLGIEQGKRMAGGEVDLPPDIVALLRQIGRAEWGQTPAHDADGHADHVRESVQLTAEHFEQSGPQHMHGLYIEGTGTVICHTGTSPNSPQIARALTGAWNYLYDQFAALTEQQEEG